MQKINKDAFEKVQLARDPKRPYTNDLLESVFTDFVELHETVVMLTMPQ